MNVPLGPRNPTVGIPRRRARSVRRTTSIDMTFPEGFAGELRLRGRGRDLLTDARGSTTVLDEAEFEASVDFPRGQLVTALATTPPRRGIETTLGTRAGGGYRKHLHELAAEHGLQGSLQLQLLDDLSGASLVAGYAPQLALGTVDPEGSSEPADPTGIMLAMADVCAGWRTGGALLAGVAATGQPPLRHGPLAPTWEDEGDELAWHHVPALTAANAMRRLRRIDVVAPEGDGPVVVDTAFRDTHVDDDGAVTIVHEYTLLAEVDPSTLHVLRITATPRVLPFAECPEAAASAGRLVGRSIAGLRARARTELVGASTCTHLNDVLRALEDVDALLARLDPEGAR